MEVDVVESGIASSFNQTEIANVTKQAKTKIQVYQYAEFLNSRLNFTLRNEIEHLLVSYRLFEIKGNVVLSLVKKAESQAGHIIKVYNGRVQETLEAERWFNHPVEKVKKVALKEAPKRELQIQNQTVLLSGIGHAQFITLYVE